MLEIQEKFSHEGYEALLERASEPEKLHITEALDKGEAIGFIAYSYECERTVVYDYSDGGDLLLCDGLVRSVLFKTCLKGIDTVEFQLSDKQKYENLVKLRFLNEGASVLENPDSFMNSCKNCNKGS